MTPCKVFFFSSRRGLGQGDLVTNRLNVYIGFPPSGEWCGRPAVRAACGGNLEPPW
jgi:hypothetical protein